MRRGIGRFTLVGTLAVLLLAPAGHAAQSRWYSQALDAPVSSTAAGVGIDEAGTVTVLSFDRGRIFGRARAAGQPVFGAPVDLGPVGRDERHYASSQSAQLGVSASGEVLVVWADKICPWGGPRSCEARLYARTGPSISQLSPPELLTEDGHHPTLAVAPDGHMAVAWLTAMDFGATAEVALRPPHGTFSAARQRLGNEGPEDDWVRGQAGPSVSINAKGQAAVVWQQAGPNGLQAKAAYRDANGSFGTPEVVAQSGPATENVEAKVAVDTDGGALVALAGRAPGYVWRPPGGSFSPPIPFAGMSWGHSLRLVASGGVQMMAWSHWRGMNGEPATVRMTGRSTGGPFGQVRNLQMRGYLGGEFGVDARGNLHTAWQSNYDGAIQAATVNRLDLVPSEVSGALTSGPLTGPTLVAVNARGHAVGLVGIGTPTARSDLDYLGLRFFERSPDTSPPGVDLYAATRARGLTRTRVRCSESCLASVSVEATYRHKRKTRRPVTRRVPAVTLRPGPAMSLSVRFTRAERGRLRKLMRQRRSPRAHVALMVEDSSGNRTQVRRRVSLRRLLR